MKIEKILGGLVSLGMVAAMAVPLALAKSQDSSAPQASGKESLSLTDDQKAKVKDIFADAKTKHQTVANDTSLTDDQKKAKLKELHEGTLAKVNAVLTPDQQTELKSKIEAAKTKPPSQP
jgi:Spy/CpxP family protein refolding chaperone